VLCCAVQMSPGALVSFMLYQQSLSSAFSMMGDVFSALTAAVGAADKVSWVRTCITITRGASERQVDSIRYYDRDTLRHNNPTSMWASLQAGTIRPVKPKHRVTTNRVVGRVNWGTWCFDAAVAGWACVGCSYSSSGRGRQNEKLFARLKDRIYHPVLQPSKQRLAA
jgi:hypothetical protein